MLKIPGFIIKPGIFLWVNEKDYDNAMIFGVKILGKRKFSLFTKCEFIVREGIPLKSALIPRKQLAIPRKFTLFPRNFVEIPRTGKN